MTVYEKIRARARLNMAKAREAILTRDLIGAHLYTSSAEEDYALLKQLPVIALEVEAEPWVDEESAPAQIYVPVVTSGGGL